MTDRRSPDRDGSRERARDRIRQVAAPVTAWLKDAAAVQAGDIVLELAAGAGDAGFALLDDLGPTGRLISSDLSPAALELARRTAAERGVGGVDFRVLDAERLELPSASVDAVICRWGYMLMGDPASALRETARVLRPGGRVALSVWGDRARNPWTTIDAEVAAHVGYRPPNRQTDPRGIFSLAQPARLREVVEQSALTVRQVKTIPVHWPYRGVEDYLAIEIGDVGDRADHFRRLPRGARAAAVELAARLLEPFRDNRGYLVPGETLNLSAEKR